MRLPNGAWVPAYGAVTAEMGTRPFHEEIEIVHSISQAEARYAPEQSPSKRGRSHRHFFFESLVTYCLRPCDHHRCPTVGNRFGGRRTKAFPRRRLFV